MLAFAYSKKYAEMSGIHINRDKQNVVWIGKNKYRLNQLGTNQFVFKNSNKKMR